MRLKKLSLVLITLFIISLPSIYASYITLQTSLKSTNNEVIFSIINKGDESAYNVHPRLLFPKQASSELREELKIDAILSDTIKIDTSDLLSGSYPLIMQIEYTDANNYPFSAIATSTISIGKPTNPGLILSLDPIKLAGSEKIKLEIKNLDDSEKELTARLIVPTELTVSEKQTITISGRNTEKVSLKLEDFSARPESNYAIFAIVEYDKDGKHFTSIQSTTVSIEKNLNVPTSLLMSSLVLLISVFIIYKIRKRNESKRSNTNLE